jgi:uroporphyrinogen decarboxylase
MDSRQRVRLALSCRPPDRIPKALSFASVSVAAVAPATAEDHFRLDMRHVQFTPPPEHDSFMSYLGGLPEDVHVGNLAQLRTYHEWDYHPEVAGSARLGAAQTLPELAQHALPPPARPWRYQDLTSQVAAWHAAGFPVAGAPPHLGGDLFESASRLRGFETFMLDMLERPALAHYLLDQLLTILIHDVTVLAQAGIDVLLLDDDVAMPTGLLISPAMWRKYFKSRLAAAIAAARAIAPEIIVFYHSDGNFTSLIPELIEIGVNVINPVQPDCMDAAMLKRQYGDRLAFWGTVGTAALWDHGSPRDVRAEVRRRIETLGPGGLLLSPAYDIDFTPLANLEAFADAVEAYGC